MQQQQPCYQGASLPYQCQYPDYNAHQVQQPYCYPDQQFYPSYPNWPCQNYDVAPGGPLSAVDYYNQNAQHDPCATQPYYPNDPNNYQTAPYDPNYVSQTMAGNYDNQQCIPNLPAGAKIVAEYFLGYLDEQPNNHQANQAYQSPQPYQQQQYLSSSSTSER